MPANGYKYSNALLQIVKQNLNLETANIKALLVSPDYVFDHTHVNRSQITNEVTNTGGSTGYEHKDVENVDISLVGSRVQVTCDNIAYTAINTAENIRGVIFYVDNGSAASDTLISYLQGLELSTNGSDVEIRIDPEGFAEFTNVIPD